MFGFKASRSQANSLIGANVAGNFKLNPMLLYHSENSRAFKNYAKLTLPVPYRWNNEVLLTTHLFRVGFTTYFKSSVETCAEKKIFFQNITVF